MSKKISLLFALSTIGFAVGLYILKFYQCNNSLFCFYFYTRVGDPLFYGMGALALVFLLLLFIPRAFSAWKKFAIWFVPLAVILFIFYPEPGSGDYFSPYPEQVFKWVSVIYVLISSVIIGWTALKKKG